MREIIFGCSTECEEAVRAYGASIEECLDEWACGASDGIHEVKVAEGEPVLVGKYLPDLTWILEQVEENISSDVYADDAIIEPPTHEAEEEFSRLLAQFFDKHIKQRQYWLFNIKPRKIELEIKDEKVVAWKILDLDKSDSRYVEKGEKHE